MSLGSGTQKLNSELETFDDKERGSGGGSLKGKWQLGNDKERIRPFTKSRQREGDLVKIVTGPRFLV